MYKALGFVAMLCFLAGCGGGATSNDPIFTQSSDVYQAAAAGDLESVRGYIQGGQWDPNAPDGVGITVLNYAVESGNVELVRLVVQSGADPNQIDAKLRKPLQVAESSGHPEVAAVLRELGAQDAPQ